MKTKLRFADAASMEGRNGSTEYVSCRCLAGSAGRRGMGGEEAEWGCREGRKGEER